MSTILFSLSVWLHTVATVIFIGHYLLLSLIYLPAIRATDAERSGPILSEISRRSRAWLYASLLIFILTGSYMTLVDPNYLGFANFGNPWGILMLIKHTLILVMICLGFWFNAVIRVGPLMKANTGVLIAIERFRRYSNLMAAAGVLVLLLTALAQVQ